MKQLGILRSLSIRTAGVIRYVIYAVSVVFRDIDLGGAK